MGSIYKENQGREDSAAAEGEQGCSVLLRCWQFPEVVSKWVSVLLFHKLCIFCIYILQ